MRHDAEVGIFGKYNGNLATKANKPNGMWSSDSRLCSCPSFGFPGCTFLPRVWLHGNTDDKDKAAKAGVNRKLTMRNLICSSRLLNPHLVITPAFKRSHKRSHNFYTTALLFSHLPDLTIVSS